MSLTVKSSNNSIKLLTSYAVGGSCAAGNVCTMIRQQRRHQIYSGVWDFTQRVVFVGRRFGTYFRFCLLAST